MTVYLLVLVSNIHDREMYARYGKGAMETLSKYDCKIVAASEAPTVIEGDWPYERTVLISFPNEDAVKTWHDSPEYQLIVSDRHQSSTSQLVVLPALGP